MYALYCYLHCISVHIHAFVDLICTKCSWLQDCIVIHVSVYSSQDYIYEIKLYYCVIAIKLCCLFIWFESLSQWRIWAHSQYTASSHETSRLAHFEAAQLANNALTRWSHSCDLLVSRPWVASHTGELAVTYLWDQPLRSASCDSSVITMI